MDDFLEQTAVRQRQGAFTALYYLIWLVMILFAIVALLALSSVVGVNPETGGLAFRLPALALALICAAAAYACFRGKDECRVEYDYAFTNGSLDISKVMNARRRRYLCALETQEVVSCGPASGPAFQKVLREPNVKHHNWFVNREAPLTYFYFKKKGVKHMIVLELNEAMIGVIRSKKYLQPGAWHDAEGRSQYASLS